MNSGEPCIQLHPSPFDSHETMRHFSPAPASESESKPVSGSIQLSNHGGWGVPNGKETANDLQPVRSGYPGAAAPDSGNEPSGVYRNRRAAPKESIPKLRLDTRDEILPDNQLADEFELGMEEPEWPSGAAVQDDGSGSFDDGVSNFFRAPREYGGISHEFSMPATPQPEQAAPEQAGDESGTAAQIEGELAARVMPLLRLLFGARHMDDGSDEDEDEDQDGNDGDGRRAPQDILSRPDGFDALLAPESSGSSPSGQSGIQEFLGNWQFVLDTPFGGTWLLSVCTAALIDCMQQDSLELEVRLLHAEHSRNPGLLRIPGETPDVAGLYVKAIKNDYGTGAGSACRSLFRRQDERCSNWLAFCLTMLPPPGLMSVCQMLHEAMNGRLGAKSLPWALPQGQLFDLSQWVRRISRLAVLKAGYGFGEADVSRIHAWLMDGICPPVRFPSAFKHRLTQRDLELPPPAEPETTAHAEGAEKN